MRAIDLRWFELAVRIELPDSGVLLPFLSAYFEPMVRFARPSSDGICVATMRAQVGPPPPEVPARDAGTPLPVDRSGGFLHCEGRVTKAGAVRWIWLAPFEALVRVEGPAIAVFAPDEAALRVPILRIVEDLLLDEAQRRGAVVLHASAVVAAGRAVLFCGNKGAGKTTALLRALEGASVGLLANDNVCLVEQDGGYLARAWPAFLKVEAGTVASTGPLVRDLPPACAPWLDDTVALWDIYEKVAFYTSQGAARFGAKVITEAPLGVLVLPRFRPDHPPALSSAPAAEVAAELPTFLQGVFNPNHGPWLGHEVDRETVRANLDRFLAWIRRTALPTYALSWAPSLGDLLGRLPLLGATRRDPTARGDAGDTVDWPPLPTAPSAATITFKSQRAPPSP